MSKHQTDVINQVFGYSSHRLYAISLASQMFSAAHKRGLMVRIRSALTGSSHHLLSLEAFTCDVRARHYAGVQTVPVRHIRGSEGRCADFDVDFRPLRTHSKERWLRIAVAQQAGEVMPPVKLIRIGEIYFVRDGHHRVSVAQALGQKEIEAEVTVWQIAGPPPWEPQVQSCVLMNQSMGQVACTRGKTSMVRVV